MAACLTTLSPGELRHASRMSNPGAIQEFIKGRALLRAVLATHCDRAAQALEIVTDAFGKPRLRGSAGCPQFNVSHSGTRALIAISPAAVGVDIEAIKEIDYLAVAAVMFSTGEREMIRSKTGDRLVDAFFTIWTRKEAYLKAMGCGFSSELAMISAASPDGVVEDRSHSGSDRPWHFYDLPAAPGYKAALATRSPKAAIHVAQVTALPNASPGNPRSSSLRPGAPTAAPMALHHG